MTEENVAVDPAENWLHTELSELIKDIEEGVQAANQLTRPSVDARMFHDVFLPFFAGDAAPKYPNVSMQHWMRIAMNPFQEVDIVDVKGHVLATVPPLHDRTAIGPTDATGSEGVHRNRLMHVYSNVILLAGRSPKSAEAYFAEEIQGRMQKGIDKHPAIRYAQMWNRVYELFERELPYPAAEDFVLDDEGRILSIKGVAPDDFGTETTPVETSPTGQDDDEDFEIA